MKADRSQIASRFDAALHYLAREMPEPVRLHLLRHERKELCVTRVCEQIEIAENAANIGGYFDASRFHELIDTSAAMFANAALGHAENQALSHAEKVRMAAEADRFKRAEEAVADMEKEAKDTRLHSIGGRVAR